MTLAVRILRVAREHEKEGFAIPTQEEIKTMSEQGARKHLMKEGVKGKELESRSGFHE